MYTYAPRRRQASWLTIPLLIPILLIALVVIFQMTRGLPAVASTTTIADMSLVGAPTQPALPAGGASLISVSGIGTIGTVAPDQPRPIASMTKMMTAWLLLKNHPLKAGETGPTITLTDADARRYVQMINEDQSAVPVTSGLRLTELQLLQGMLVASANNFAEYAANWDSGSVAAFVTKMNAEAQALGMTKTTYADVSGISPRSMSTPADLLILERKIMADPVLRPIVAMKTITIQGIGTLPAVNEILGEAGVIGIKTGFTEEAGGNLAFAAEKTIGSQKVEVVGVIMGQDTRPAAFSATRRALESLDRDLKVVEVLPAGQPVAIAKPEWGGEVDVVTETPAAMLMWPGMTMKTTVLLDPIKSSMKAGTRVGTLVVGLGEQQQEVPLVLAKDIDGAGMLWKLFRF